MPASFPCFSGEHGHPPAPGKWMARSMERILSEFRALAVEAGEPGVIQSVENPCNEYCLPLIQQSDVRGAPPDRLGGTFVPLYHYLFHECTVMHGMMSLGFEPYALPMRTAYNGVIGEIPGAVMTGDGTLLNRETYNWAEWEPKIGSNDDALGMLRTVTALRRGPGRDFLVFGRMLPPASLEGVADVRWEWEGRPHAVPAVFDAAWRAPDGRHAVVLANWTTEPQEVTVSDARLGQEALCHMAGRELLSEHVSGGSYAVTVPALGCVLLEGCQPK